jgi:hypothetical protein
VTRHFVLRHHGSGLACAVAVVLAWVAVGPPAATHAEPPTISVVERVAPGDQLKVDGVGWTGKVEVRLSDAAGASTVAMPDDRGEIHAKLRVPFMLHYGDHTVTAICKCAARAAAHVTVAPTAYAAPNQAVAGSIPPWTSPSPSRATHPMPPPSTAIHPISTASSSSYRPQRFLGWALVLAATTAALAITVTRLRRVRRRPRASDIDVHLDDRANASEVVGEQPSSRPLIRVAAEATAPTVTVTEESR